MTKRTQRNGVESSSFEVSSNGLASYDAHHNSDAVGLGQDGLNQARTIEWVSGNGSSVHWGSGHGDEGCGGSSIEGLGRGGSDRGGPGRGDSGRGGSGLRGSGRVGSGRGGSGRPKLRL